MLEFLPVNDPALIALVFGVAAMAGVVKGIVGFAMPMILISGLSSVISPELALAGLILPTVATNVFQALRQGMKAAWQSIKRFRVFLLAGGVTLIFGAQVVRFVDASVMLTGLGLFVGIFSAMQLFGWKPKLEASTRVEAITGAIAGAIGGFSGVWGPPTVAYLTAVNTDKQDQIRIQGVIYGLGAVALAVAHIGSGILNAKTAPFSALLLLPALLGLWIGASIHDRIDQVAFKKATLAVLMLASLNLLRRGIMG